MPPVTSNHMFSSFQVSFLWAANKLSFVSILIRPNLCNTLQMVNHSLIYLVIQYVDLIITVSFEAKIEQLYNDFKWLILDFYNISSVWKYIKHMEAHFSIRIFCETYRMTDYKPLSCPMKNSLPFLTILQSTRWLTGFLVHLANTNPICPTVFTFSRSFQMLHDSSLSSSHSCSSVPSRHNRQWLLIQSRNCVSWLFTCWLGRRCLLLGSGLSLGSPRNKIQFHLLLQKLNIVPIWKHVKYYG